MAFEGGDLTARLHAEFPHALRHGQVIGYFQPEIELATGRLAGAELLARWEHPELGTLPPTRFTAIAEELGLMGEFTRLMLRQALTQHQAWAADGWVIPISVNIGPDSVIDPDFPATVEGMLREEQVPGPMLALELSEETGTQAASTRFFAQLTELGVQLSLDDFGTGFASLESLGGWPIDELKLDRSIVRPVVSSPSFRAIVRTSIDLAHQLGLKVVAEGVESEAVCSELRALGCDVGQGFFLGRPMPAAAFAEWLRDPARCARRTATFGGLARAAGRPDRLLGGTARSLRRVAQPTGGAALAAATAMLAVYGLWLGFRWGGPAHRVLINDLASLAADVVAVIFAGRVSRRADLGRPTCRAWALVTAGLATYLVGHLLQLGYREVLHQQAYPAWITVPYLCGFLAAFCGLISFPARRRSAAERRRLLLDLGTVLTAGAILIWYVALGPLITANRHFDLLDLFTYAFPAGDLLLLFGILTVLARGGLRQNVVAQRILVVGLLLEVASDVSYDAITVHSVQHLGDLTDTLTLLVLIVSFLAAACQLRSRSGGPYTRAAVGPDETARPSLLPYLAIMSVGPLLAVIGLRGVAFNPLGGILLGAVLLIVLVSSRQYMALRDYGRLARRYRELATIDGTSGLYNRRHFMELAEAAFAHAQRLGQPFTALMIDIDNFKHINDEHGHIAGDHVLAELAQSCREYMRAGDIVGRYGGDEFIIVTPGRTAAQAARLADQLARSVTGVLGRDGQPVSYSVSIGLADSSPGADLRTVLIHADLAMYQAKQAGGGGWQVYGAAETAGGRTGSTGEQLRLPVPRRGTEKRAVP